MSKITPFVKRMRTQGGTIYTFSSALEDIGLNINERNNVVKMSNYALLNIPSVDTSFGNLQQNKFNVLAIPGAYESYLASGSIKDGRVLIAESFQNYALNLESNLLSQADYNPSLTTTISERVFWKWLKETGAIRWVDVSTAAGKYWKEETDTDSSVGYNSVVKCIGQISAGSVRTDTFGTYNETYILVPTSFGQTPVYFKQVEDDNYYHGLSITNGFANILGRESYMSPHPDALEILAYYDLSDSSTVVHGTETMYYDNSTGVNYPGWWWKYDASVYNTFSLSNDNCYFIDSSNYIDEKKYNIKLTYTGTTPITYLRSKVDCLSIEYNLTTLRTIFNDSTLSFDSLATDSDYVEDDTFDFNTVLIYYSVYNKSLDTILATNLLGVLFLDAPSGNTSNFPILLPSITKIQSNSSGFGTSFSFRLNVKSDYMLDNTAASIVDTGTSYSTVLEDFSDVFDNLSKSLSILNQHTGTINYITEQYLDITSNQTNILNQISGIQNQVNDISRDITGTENAIAMFSAGDDPLIDSSIFMKNGNIGIFTNMPSYDFEVSSNIKVKDIILESNVKDLSDNILIGYDGSLYIGSSLNTRGIEMYGVTNLEASVNDGPVLILKNNNNGSVSSGNHRRVLDLYIDSSGYAAQTDYIRFWNADVADGFISTSSGGTLGFVDESDKILKKNIKTTEYDSLDILNKIDVVDFDWKDSKKSKKFGRRTGVIAQQAASVFKPMVVQGDTLGIMYQTLHPHYIHAIQQLTEQNKKQQNIIEQLQKDISILKENLDSYYRKVKKL